VGGEGVLAKCISCGKENANVARFCFACGASLLSAERQSAKGETVLSDLRPGAASGVESKDLEVRRVPTGIDGLDSMISGGITAGRVVLVCGGPGTGKTTVSLQFLVNGCLKYSERGLFVSLDEPLRKVLTHTGSLGWNLQQLMDKRMIGFIEAPRQENRRFSIDQLIDAVTKKANELGVQRISLDPLTYVSIHYPDIVARRSALLRLFDALSDIGATCLVTNEIRAESGGATLLEEYLADGVIRLRSSQIERWKVRTIEVEKMRGTSIDDQIRPYTIGKDGISVISEKDIFSYAASLFAPSITKEEKR